MLRVLLFIICSITINLISNKSYALVGLESTKTNSNKNIPNKQKDKKNKQTENNNKTKNTSKSLVQTGSKPNNVPDFPNDGEKEYKMLFDEGFSNVVDNSFQDGEEWDVFINQEQSNEINKKYIAGNNDEPSQLEVIEAEEKTMFDKIILDKGNITTHRRRVMAYLTLDQMLFSDILDQHPHGYYINAMSKKG